MSKEKILNNPVVAIVYCHVIVENTASSNSTLDFLILRKQMFF